MYVILGILTLFYFIIRYWFHLFYIFKSKDERDIAKIVAKTHKIGLVKASELYRQKHREINLRKKKELRKKKLEKLFENEENIL